MASAEGSGLDSPPLPLVVRSGEPCDPASVDGNQTNYPPGLDLGTALVMGLCLIGLVVLPPILTDISLDFGFLALAIAVAGYGVFYASASPDRRRDFVLAPAEWRQWRPVWAIAALPVFVIGLLVGGSAGRLIAIGGTILITAVVFVLAKRSAR